MKNRLSIIPIVLLFVLGVAPPSQDVPLVAQTLGALDLYPDPGGPAPVVTVPAQTTLHVHGRDVIGAQFFVSIPRKGARGWGPAAKIALQGGSGLADVPVLNVSPPPLDLPAPPPLTSPAAPNAALMEQLYAVPVLPTHISARMKKVFQRGQRAGMRPDVFAKVGDCETASRDFLAPFGEPFYNMGPYGWLQRTIHYFSATEALPGEEANAFNRTSQAAVPAFTTSSVLDPLWADPEHCQPGESPLMCEYRLLRPSFALIMLGEADIYSFTLEEYKQHMREIVTNTLEQGIIPVLTIPASAPEAWYLKEKQLDFNVALLEIATEEAVPLINMWLAARGLPDGGLVESGQYLTIAAHGLSFEGDERLYGQTLRNLVTLQALETVRRASFAWLYTEPPDPTGIRFENGMRFHGLKMPGDSSIWHRGETRQVYLWWSVDQPLSYDYSIGVYLLDEADEQLFAQADGPMHIVDWNFHGHPRQTSALAPGAYSIDVRRLHLPAEMPKGIYTLHMAVYQPWDGVRLAATADNPETLIYLTDIVIE